jgi:hypothetical protein
MSDVVLSPQTVALVGGLMSALVLAISALSGAIVFLYRQILTERDRLLTERDRNQRGTAHDPRTGTLRDSTSSPIRPSHG